MSSAGGRPSGQTMASVRTSIVPPGPRPPPPDTPGTSPVATTSQATASLHDFAVSLLSTGSSGRRQTGQVVSVRVSATCRPEVRRVTGRSGGSKQLQCGGPASPEMTPRSQARKARTTSSGSATARGVADPAIQSEITAMRARNWPSASTEARTTKILVRRAGLASSGICRSSGSEHH
jgi:hypothetical protein